MRIKDEACSKGCKTSVVGQLSWCTLGEASVVEQPKAVGKLKDEFEVMGREENSLSACTKLLEKLQRADLCRKVEESCRFVQKDEGSILSYGAGNHGALPFTIADFAYASMAQMLECAKLQGVVYGGVIGVAKTSRKPHVGYAPKGYNVGNGKCPNTHGGGENDGDVAGCRPRSHASAEGRQETGECTQ